MSGLFISFEGIDGAGKSTHINALVEAFETMGRNVVRTREPGGTPLAETLRELVLNKAMDPMTEALLVFAARRDHIVQVIQPALSQGAVVLCDRFTDSSFAYQGGGRSFDWNVLESLERWVQVQSIGSILQPDVTIWFDLPSNVAAIRLQGARVPDKFESQSEPFFDRVAQAYAKRMSSAPDRFVRVNSNQAAADVWSDIHAVLVAKGVLV
ncbi:dTMP kinase [Rhodoferax aquaticus]|uniref:Thymidylate kinase n=1 Tax=Rhodoferax aquaticus TaxID=2527691 RepID=A0A515EPN8_9BURK|nr:dTMP kinase [Rhodoferax aquaticus]QDL54632.1 dTMP kinase [Rhodoferax aquaticus]